MLKVVRLRLGCDMAFFLKQTLEKEELEEILIRFSSRKLSVITCMYLIFKNIICSSG